MRRALAVLTIFAAVSYELPALARGCSEVSDIVGFERCRRFGSLWSREAAIPLSLELTFGPLFIDPKSRTIGGGFGKHQKGSFSYPGALVGHDLTSWLVGMRIGYSFVPWAYAGLELALGPGSNELPPARSGDYTMVRASGVETLGVAAGAYGGFRLPLGYFSLRAEMFFGADALDITQSAIGSNGVRRVGIVSLDSWRIEPRFYADIWALPWMTLSGYGGFDLVHKGDHLGGLSVGFHGAHYDDGFLF